MTESESVALPLGDAALQNSLYYSRFIRICQGFSAIFFAETAEFLRLSGAWPERRLPDGCRRRGWAAKSGRSARHRAPGPAGDDAINMRRGWFGCPGRKTRTIYRVAGGLPGAGRWGWQPAGSGVISACGAVGLGLSWPQKRGGNPGACGIPGFRLFFTPV